ncbi:MAG: DUF4230 domain-containing protein [Roseiflexus sp.]|jgi:hypothetical protein|nr:DUF4230 domain-containing protein [Roseiflexus sp.]MBO9365868.1 DUF4230 domain-containing protein [Roseiflexus sp.]MBO9381768.1 DUF4230 domain-containing protein [Roseiflexus sp.]MBO9388586.1 DUF4230 domain-containing protein [Roseiflexus sp.]
MPRYDDESEEEEERPHQFRRRELRRESLMERRLRRARGEEVDDVIEEEPLYLPYDPVRTVRYGMPLAGGGCAATALYAALGAITVVLLLMLFWQRIVATFALNVPQQVLQVIATPTPTIRDWGGAIQQMKNLNRLETQRFSIERVVEASTARGDPLDALLGERLLLIASGDVVAGVDLSKLTERDVIISPDGASVTLTLPASEIFSARLNNERTRVYDRQTRLLTQLTGGQDPNLETQARQEAERQILAAACENGIMQRAADEAKRSMEQFLRLLEFEQITVIATPGPCVVEQR